MLTQCNQWVTFSRLFLSKTIVSVRVPTLSPSPLLFKSEANLIPIYRGGVGSYVFSISTLFKCHANSIPIYGCVGQNMSLLDSNPKPTQMLFTGGGVQSHSVSISHSCSYPKPTQFLLMDGWVKFCFHFYPNPNPTHFLFTGVWGHILSLSSSPLFFKS